MASAAFEALGAQKLSADFIHLGGIRVRHRHEDVVLSIVFTVSHGAMTAEPNGVHTVVYQSWALKDTI